MALRERKGHQARAVGRSTSFLHGCGGHGFPLKPLAVARAGVRQEAIRQGLCMVFSRPDVGTDCGYPPNRKSRRPCLRFWPLTLPRPIAKTWMWWATSLSKFVLRHILCGRVTTRCTRISACFQDRPGFKIVDPV